MNRKFTSLIAGIAIFLTSTQVLAQSITDLNTQLNSAVNGKDWNLAIQVIDRLIIAAPDQSSKLKDYREKLKQMSFSSVKIQEFYPARKQNAVSIEFIKGKLEILEKYTANGLSNVQESQMMCNTWINRSPFDKAPLHIDASLADCSKFHTEKRESLLMIEEYLPPLVSVHTNRCQNHENNDDCQWARNQIIRIRQKYWAIKESDVGAK